MANFKTFTNASAPYEGKKIAIDMDRISCFYEDVLKADEGNRKLIFRNFWIAYFALVSSQKILKILLLMIHFLLILYH